MSNGLLCKIVGECLAAADLIGTRLYDLMPDRERPVESEADDAAVEG